MAAHSPLKGVRQVVEPTPFPWPGIFEKPVVDLTALGGDALSGIYSPQYEEETVDRYLHRQFREGATEYEAHTNPEHGMKRALRFLRLLGYEPPVQAPLTILDLASGAGLSVFPLLELCPNARIVASDLSLDMLALLQRGLKEQGLCDRCILLQLNAEELDFYPETFDLVVGASALHHLFAPEQTIQGCSRILKPGGRALFFEPFEEGYLMMRLIFRAILADTRSTKMSQPVRQWLERRSDLWNFTKGRDKAHPRFFKIEDKWLFTHAFFYEQAEQAGFSKCRVFPQASGFEKKLEILFRAGACKDLNCLPEWARDIARQFDDNFSLDAKQHFIFEGGIILTK